MSRPNVDVELTADWVQVSADGNPICAVTIVGILPLLVRVATAKPAASQTFGARLSPLHPFWSINDLTGAQKVWARAVGISATVTLN